MKRSTHIARILSASESRITLALAPPDSQQLAMVDLQAPSQLRSVGRTWMQGLCHEVGEFSLINALAKTGTATSR